MIIWGGSAPERGEQLGRPLGDGARYNPQTRTWRPMSEEGAPAPRRGHTATWTGSEMIVWGGYGDTFYSSSRARNPDDQVFGDGARYDPIADVWRPMSAEGAPSPRALHSAVWTGSEMIVWGGPGLADGGRYDPAGDAWLPLLGEDAPADTGHYLLDSRPFGAWTGAATLFWGGTTGGLYSPALDTWRSMPEMAPRELTGPTGVRDVGSYTVGAWTGSQLVVWGGYATRFVSYLANGAVYDPNSNSWQEIDGPPGMHGRAGNAAVWDGRDVIFWGGDSYAKGTSFTPYGDGARFNPTTGKWSILPPAPAAARYRHSAVWTGTEMIVWGGTGSRSSVPDSAFNDGAAYIPPC